MLSVEPSVPANVSVLFEVSVLPAVIVSVPFALDVIVRPLTLTLDNPEEVHVPLSGPVTVPEIVGPAVPHWMPAGMNGWLSHTPLTEEALSRKRLTKPP